MANDLYSDTGEDVEVNESDAPKKDAATALIPKSFFPSGKDLSVGNECKIKIERVMDDQVSVTYVSDHKEESEDDDMVVEEVSEVDSMMT